MNKPKNTDAEPVTEVQVVEPVSTDSGMPPELQFRLGLIAEVASAIAGQVYIENIRQGRPGLPEQTRQAIVKDANKLVNEILKIN